MQPLLDALLNKYGFSVTAGDLKLAILDMQQGRTREKIELSSRISHYWVVLRGMPVLLAYDRKAKIITQILDPVSPNA